MSDDTEATRPLLEAIDLPQRRLGESHSPLTRLIVDQLRERILSGTIAGGERLVEARLSEELGVSRMPVREALRQLASEGIVTIEPRRGATVTQFTEEQVRELVEVRATLEGLNARLAARRHDPAKIAELQAILSEGVRLSEGGDPMVLIRLNERFHDALANIASNSILRDIMRSLRDRTALLFAPLNRNHGTRIWEEHAAILRAVIAGDSELAALLATRHVYSAAQMPPTP
ncbi:GntR family transcriptional regulator [Ramlibacter monticola]|uniref:GntR family transcriptional regulator n=1 Tax=Ramlibacter monticola TaxID=1926872 RepID=A0A937CUI0_9BURK|nr:GntR family transcriptional regulator [Ramlibacter monticola]MBL0393391.1 GntR family transcriptional regulator [Ramlibacter monticola]